MNELLSLRETAKRLRTHHRNLSRAIKSGELRAFQIGERDYRIAWSDVEAWLEQHHRVVPVEPSDRAWAADKAKAARQ